MVLVWPVWLRRQPEQQSPIWKRRSLILLISLLTARYLHWRITSSLNLSTNLSTGLSLLLLTAEAWLLLSGLLPLWLAWRRFPDRRGTVQQLQDQWQNSDWRPTVDILVPTYGEPLEVLERSLIACSHQNYRNHCVWVLDDSGRDEVKELALKHGCHYRHRPARTHAKAGNLNDGLKHCSSELVAVLDADFIPQRNFLDCCIGFLRDPSVGLLQTPQTFINADPVMRNLGMERWLLPDEESFYRWIEPVRDSWGAVVCAGTAFLARRSAIDSVGGFKQEAISEDFVTGLRLRRKGWKLLYLQQKLSAGLAAETMADFVRQRQRWANGTLQSLRLRDGPLGPGDLRFGERMAYLEGVVHWFNNMPRLVLMLMPLSYGLLGTLPILISTSEALRMLLPLWATLLLSIGWINRGSRTALLSELTGWVLTVPLTLTVFTNLMGHIGGFRVTPKHQKRNRGSFSIVLVIPLLVLLVLNLVNLFGLVATASLDSEILDSRPLGLTWAVINLLSLWIALRACWDPPARDPAPWQAVSLPAELEDGDGEWRPCRITALSESGVELEAAMAMPAVAKIGRLRWTDDVQALPVELETSKGNQLALRWQELSDTARQQLILWLFCRPYCWPERQATPEWRALIVLISRLFILPSRRPFHRCLMPQNPPPPHSAKPEITGPCDRLSRQQKGHENIERHMQTAHPQAPGNLALTGHGQQQKSEQQKSAPGVRLPDRRGSEGTISH